MHQATDRHWSPLTVKAWKKHQQPQAAHQIDKTTINERPILCALQPVMASEVTTTTVTTVCGFVVAQPEWEQRGVKKQIETKSRAALPHFSCLILASCECPPTPVNTQHQNRVSWHWDMSSCQTTDRMRRGFWLVQLRIAPYTCSSQAVRLGNAEVLNCTTSCVSPNLKGYVSTTTPHFSALHTAT